MVRVYSEVIDTLTAVCLLEAQEAHRQYQRFREMYDKLPIDEGKETLAYVRKMRDHWQAREGAYLALADSIGTRQYPLTHVRRAIASALVQNAERIIEERISHGERDTELEPEGASEGDRGGEVQPVQDAGD